MDKHPPEGPPPSLPRHVACALRRARLERRHLGAGPALSPRKRREEGEGRPGLGDVVGRGGRFGGVLGTHKSPGVFQVSIYLNGLTWMIGDPPFKKKPPSNFELGIKTIENLYLNYAIYLRAMNIHAFFEFRRIGESFRIAQRLLRPWHRVFPDVFVNILMSYRA